LQEKENAAVDGDSISAHNQQVPKHTQTPCHAPPAPALSLRAAFEGNESALCVLEDTFVSEEAGGGHALCVGGRGVGNQLQEYKEIPSQRQFETNDLEWERTRHRLHLTEKLLLLAKDCVGSYK